jgi:phosphoadenosine phosphosulfate reductase
MDLEHMAIERLQAASEMSLMHYGEPLIITDSGGKDSSVIKELARRAGIPFEVMHNHTTADAPETVRFVRAEAKRFEDMGIKYTINMPMYKGKRTSMWSLIPQKLMPPTRLVRYCCSVLKETGGAGRFIATGVRWAESASRKNSRGVYEKNGDTKHRIILNNDNDDRRMLFENCKLKAKRTVNPIIDWTDDDVWNFLTSDDAPPCNPLYCEGWKRVGCVGCPMAGTKGREFQFARWPKYKDLYLLAFGNLLA